jgi:hypothetical protein
MKYTFLLIIALLLLPEFAGAAFRFKKQSPAAQHFKTEERHIMHQAGQAFALREAAAFEQTFRRFVPARYRHAAQGPELGIASFVAALLSICCIALATGAGTPFFLIAGGVLAVAAIVLGALGLKRDMKGLAIAGLTIGSVVIITGIVYAIMLGTFLAALFG